MTQVGHPLSTQKTRTHRANCGTPSGPQATSACGVAAIGAACVISDWPMRIAVFCTCPNNVVSGGRYHAMMIAQAMARRGHDAFFVTNNVPALATDLAPLSPDNPVRIIKTADFDVTSLAHFDAVVLAPQMGAWPRLCRNTLRFADATRAGLVL